MENELYKKKTTAPDTSVGADDGQPLHNSTENSITENISQNNYQIVNPQNNLPAEIMQVGRFCCWRHEERDGRKTKVPYNPLTGQMARSNDVGSFADFKAASSATGYENKVRHEGRRITLTFVAASE